MTVHIKYSRPSKFEKAPPGTVWKIIGESGTELFVQSSLDQDHPVWILMGDFLVEIFKDHVEDDGFMAMCISKKRSPDKKISLFL